VSVGRHLGALMGGALLPSLAVLVRVVIEHRRERAGDA
jgi:hypothetical protein